MESILFYDQESTGLIEYKLPSSDPSQPYITQIAAELCVEKTGETLGAINMIILPEGWEIPQELQVMTGITMERAFEFGVPIKTALAAFIDLWMNSDIRCGHNESFDARLTRIALMRDSQFSGEVVGDAPFADYWKTSPAYCTQANSTKIVNAARPAGEKKKTASLIEAYKHFTGQDLVGAHNAQVDIMACKAVYYSLKKHNAAA